MLQVFHCVHFECPAQVSNTQSDAPKDKEECKKNLTESPLPPPPTETATEVVNIDHEDDDSLEGYRAVEGPP